MELSNKTYDFLKNLALVWLPAIATLVIGVFKIWSIPNGELVAGTITLVATFIGSILEISSKNYNSEEK